MSLPCSPPFRCPRTSLPGGALPIVTQASHLTDSYLNSLFAPYEDQGESCDPGLDPDHIDGKRVELDCLDHQIGVARMQAEILRLSLERARKKHAELEVLRKEVLVSANHLVGPALAVPNSKGSPASDQLFGVKSAANLPAEILLKIFSFLYKTIGLEPSESQLSLRRDKALNTYFHSASITLPHELVVKPLGTQEDMQNLHNELLDGERRGLKFAVHISPASEQSNFDTLGLALSYPHRWFMLIIQDMSHAGTSAVLRRCEQVLQHLRHLQIRNYHLAYEHHFSSQWSNGCEPVMQRLRSAEMGHLYLPMLGGLLSNVVELTVVIMFPRPDPDKNIFESFRGGQSLRKLTVRCDVQYPPSPDTINHVDLTNLEEIRLEIFVHDSAVAVLKQLNCPNVRTVGLKLSGHYIEEESAKLFREIDRRWQSITTLCLDAGEFLWNWKSVEIDQFMGKILNFLHFCATPFSPSPLNAEHRSDWSTYQGHVGYMLFQNLQHLHLDLPYLKERGLTALFGLVTERRRGDSVASIQTLKLSLGEEVFKDQAQILESLQFYVEDATYTTRSDPTRD